MALSAHTMRIKEFNPTRSLSEIRMSPSALLQQARTVPALAGMEFEMAFPSPLGRLPSEDPPGPDVSTDQRITDLHSIEAFFTQNRANSLSDVRGAVEDALVDYDDWLEQRADTHWRRRGRAWLRSRLLQDFRDSAAELLQDETPQLSTDSIDTMVDDLVLQDFDEHVSSVYSGEDPDLLEDMFNEFVSDNADNIGDHVEYLNSSGINTQLEFFQQHGEDAFLQWPTQGQGRGSDSELVVVIRGIALDFMQSLGHDQVAAADSYHGVYYKYSGDQWVKIGKNKPTDCYTLEPDSSVDYDVRGSSTEYLGLEFVSPPLTLDQLTQDLARVKSWALQQGAVTNSSTGLHINVSVSSGNFADLDYVKLALLLGDAHVLELFNRTNNQYAASYAKYVTQALGTRDPGAALDQLRRGLSASAANALMTRGTGLGKYFSIHPKNGYIEFRSPGGDWLEQNFQYIVPTMNRFVVAMAAAMDPSAYRKEYLTKLYSTLSGGKQLQYWDPRAPANAKQPRELSDEPGPGLSVRVKPESHDDAISIFSQYLAGYLDEHDVKFLLKRRQRNRMADTRAAATQGVATGQTTKNYSVTHIPTGVSSTITATDPAHARTRIAGMFGMPNIAANFTVDELI